MDTPSTLKSMLAWEQFLGRRHQVLELLETWTHLWHAPQPDLKVISLSQVRSGQARGEEGRKELSEKL